MDWFIPDYISRIMSCLLFAVAAGVDVLIATLAFCFALPLFILTFLFLFFANSGKPIFFQTRPGKNGEIFKIIKFIKYNNYILYRIYKL